MPKKQRGREMMGRKQKGKKRTRKVRRKRRIQMRLRNKELAAYQLLAAYGVRKNGRYIIDGSPIKILKDAGRKAYAVRTLKVKGVLRRLRRQRWVLRSVAGVPAKCHEPQPEDRQRATRTPAVTADRGMKRLIASEIESQEATMERLRRSVEETKKALANHEGQLKLEEAKLEALLTLDSKLQRAGYK